MRHRTRFVSLIALCALLAAPIAVMAQDGEEMQQYTSPDGFLTVSYPAEWVAQESDFLYGVVILDSQETLDLYNSVEGEEAVPSGAVIVDVTLGTLETFQMFGMPIEEGMAVDEMLEVFLGFVTSGPEGGPPAEEPAMGATAEADMGAAEEPAMDATAEADMGTAEEPAMDMTAEPGMDMGMEAPVVSETELIDFEDGRQVALARVEYGSLSSDAYMIYEVSDGIYGVVNVFTAPGELTEELIDTAVQIAQSVQFTGTPDDLAMAAPEVEESDVDPATLDGNALVDERCTVCHTRERIDAQDKDEAGWTETVDRMIGYGAELNSAERQAVIDYLVETH